MRLDAGRTESCRNANIVDNEGAYKERVPLAGTKIPFKSRAAVWPGTTNGRGLSHYRTWKDGQRKWNLIRLFRTPCSLNDAGVQKGRSLILIRADSCRKLKFGGLTGIPVPVTLFIFTIIWTDFVGRKNACLPVKGYPVSRKHALDRSNIFRKSIFTDFITVGGWKSYNLVCWKGSQSRWVACIHRMARN